MDKEQKKLLLVAVSVGVFLLVTITAAIIILTPKVNTEETAFSSSQPVSSERTQPASYLAIPTQPVEINPQEVNINRVNSEPAADAGNNTVRLNIETQSLTAPAIPPDIAPPSSSRPVVTTAAVKPAESPAPAAAQPAASPAAAARPAATRQPAPARTTNDYWIQTGAYSAIVRAEDVKELLASKGLTSIIETRVVDGRNLYRVRLGPYTSENEANYWLKLIKEIDGFGESQVRQTVRQQ